MYIKKNIYVCIYIYTIHVYLYQPGWFFRRLFNHKQKKHTQKQPARLSSNMTSNVSVSFTISPCLDLTNIPGTVEIQGLKGWTQARLYTTTYVYMYLYIYIYEFRYTQHRDSMFGFQFNVGLMLNLLLLGSWGWISFRIYELGPLADFLRSLGRLAKLSMVTGFCLTLFFWYNQLWILVGGFNPFEKYAPQNGNPSPRKGENNKNIWNHHQKKSCYVTSDESTTVLSNWSWPNDFFSSKPSFSRVQSLVLQGCELWKKKC